MGTDVKTTLMYAHDDKTRPYYYAYQRTDEEIKQTPQRSSDYGGTSVPVEMTVIDARSAPQKMSLNVNSFELVNQTTSLATQDFYDDRSKIVDVYYDEIAEAIKRATGAAHVKVFHHQVRNQEKNTGDPKNLNTSVQGYAMGIHSDSHPHSADALFRRMTTGAGMKQYQTGRFLYINAWRNIADTPIQNNPLAVCDETSLVRPDDYITADLHMGPAETDDMHIQQYRLLDRHADSHRWYYYSQMTKDELLLFKQFDSDTTLSGRLCFHTAFVDPNSTNDSVVRESIEARAIAYFPDHQPNTCPAMELNKGDEGPLAEEGDDDKVVKGGVLKLIQAVKYWAYWPAPNKDEIVKLYTEEGVKKVAETIADDEGNYQGLKNASKEIKTKIVEKVMKDGNFASIMEKNVQSHKAKKEKSGSAPSLMAKALLLMAGSAIGWVACILLHQNNTEEL